MPWLVVGLGQANESVARQLRRRGEEVVATDDGPDDATRARARSAGVELVEAPTDERLEALVRDASVVLPGPGVPMAHPCYRMAAAHGVPVWSEFELAARWAPDARLVAVTGTNGKTTVTTIVTDILQAAKVRAVAAGNNDLPLVDALDFGLDVIVVEASSFRLQHAPSFRPEVAVWLNLAEDHLDWHPDMDHYAAAKARVWANQRDSDLAIANADDPAVMEAARAVKGRLETFGLDSADWHVAGGALRTPTGESVVELAALPLDRPHDLANALAASAAAVGAGAGLDACRAVLSTFTGLPHRVQLVRDAGGVRWYDDSKATTPASVAAAVSGFPSVVLIAGGRNKGLRLDGLRDLAGHIRSVVAIGEAADVVEAVFAGVRPVERAASMDQAVAAARRVAEPGDVVLLSPGCASYDWYRNYGERGDDFARAVAEVER
ncbi:MAG: UDP-N-acetylmuramoylalanine--D-glutamate ligase [Actinomycetota bacterium]|jgi:UDP-N-acetylmuramoylalanine--D-glutamate ligase